MLQTVTSSSAVAIDVENVVGRFGIDEERAGTNSKNLDYQTKQLKRINGYFTTILPLNFSVSRLPHK